jgi:anaerobic selenocysteine-containing dehydrogenase
MNAGDPRTHHRTCPLCEAMCGLTIDVEGGRIRSIRGDPDDPFSRGHLCPKAVALADVHSDPDRVRRPLRREGGGWTEIGWDEAIDEAARGLAAVQAAHGRDAVAVYLGNPNVHNHGAVLGSQVLQRALRTRSRYSATSVDQLPHMLAALEMFGHQLLMPVPDVDRTQHFLCLGANPLASNGSLMTAPGIERRLKAMKARGGRLVVVDPRRTETAALADWHLPIRPGTDALLLLALVHTLFAEGRVRPGRLAAFTDGVETLADLARAFPPARVAEATGIAAADIERLAREHADAPSAVCYGRVGISTQEFGGLACWLAYAVNVLTGNLDRAGGMMFAQPAADVLALATRLGQRGRFATRRSRVRGLPSFGGEWPAAVLGEEIETPGPGQVRALLCVAGNPVLSTPNGARLDRALETLDFMVSVDFYLNETSRRAHLVLPPVGPLERDHYDLVFHLLAVRDTAKYAPPLFAPPADGHTDWQILLDLSRRIAAARGDRSLRTRAQYAVLDRLRPRGLVDVLLRAGPYGPRPWRTRGLTLRRLERAPHGIDLGPLRPCLPGRLGHPDRRIRLAPPALAADLARLAQSLARRPPALALIGRRDLRSNNSWMHNSARLVKGPDRCTLLMSPADAAARGLADGARVRVTSRAGTVEVALSVTDAMRDGVVSLPHGWGHHREGTRLAVAGARPGASVNDLTDDAFVDALSGTAAFNGVAVDVEPVPAIP